MAPGANKLFGIDMTGVFPSGALTGTPTVVCTSASQSGANGATGTVATSDLTIASPIVNVGSIPDDNGKTIAAGYAVQVRISGSSVDGGNYILKVGATDGTNTDYVYILLQVRATIPE